MIKSEIEDGVAILTLAHGKANALDIEFCEALTARFIELRNSAAKAVVLTGQGKIFSAGVDLKRLSEGGADYIRKFLPVLHKLYDAVFYHTKPVVAAINGHAIAGGCVLACCADRRIMARESGCTAAEVETAIRELTGSGQASAVSKKLVVGRAGFDEAAARMRGDLEEYQKRTPLSWGQLKSEMKKRVEGAIHADLVEAWVQQEADAGRLFPRGDRLRTGSGRWSGEVSLPVAADNAEVGDVNQSVIGEVALGPGAWGLLPVGADDTQIGDVHGFVVTAPLAACGEFDFVNRNKLAVDARLPFVGFPAEWIDAQGRAVQAAYLLQSDDVVQLLPEKQVGIHHLDR
jgi:hypothetical protein